MRPYIHYYNRAACAGLYIVQAGRWYLILLEVLRRCDTLRRVAGGIIAACVGLVSVAVEWGK